MCSQAAELVSKNWEAYEAHMRDVRDYLEASLEVSTSVPSHSLRLQGLGPGAGWVYPSGPAHPFKRLELLGNPEVHSPLITPGLLWETEDLLQQSL